MTMCSEGQTFHSTDNSKQYRCADNCSGDIGPYMRDICDKWCSMYLNCLSHKIDDVTESNDDVIVHDREPIPDKRDILAFFIGVAVMLIVVIVVLLIYKNKKHCAKILPFEITIKSKRKSGMGDDKDEEENVYEHVTDYKTNGIDLTKKDVTKSMDNHMYGKQDRIQQQQLPATPQTGADEGGEPVMSLEKHQRRHNPYIEQPQQNLSCPGKIPTDYHYQMPPKIYHDVSQTSQHPLQRPQHQPQMRPQHLPQMPQHQPQIPQPEPNVPKVIQHQSQMSQHSHTTSQHQSQVSQQYQPELSGDQYYIETPLTKPLHNDNSRGYDHQQTRQDNINDNGNYININHKATSLEV